MKSFRVEHMSTMSHSMNSSIRLSLEFEVRPTMCGRVGRPDEERSKFAAKIVLIESLLMDVLLQDASSGCFFKPVLCAIPTHGQFHSFLRKRASSFAPFGT